jgi:hypothetical protein
MVSALMKRVASRLTLVLLLLLAATGMVLQAGSVPHAHATNGGLYNQEHDLTLLASLGGHVVLVDAAPALAHDDVTTLVPSLAPERPALRVARSADSRAPPLR